MLDIISSICLSQYWMHVQIKWIDIKWCEGSIDPLEMPQRQNLGKYKTVRWKRVPEICIWECGQFRYATSFKHLTLFARSTRILTNRFSKSITTYISPQALNVNEFQLNVRQFESFSIYLSNTMALRVSEWNKVYVHKIINWFYCNWIDKFKWRSNSIIPFEFAVHGWC